MGASAFGNRPQDLGLKELVSSLNSLRSGMLEQRARFAGELARTHMVYRKSAENLLHYLSLRHHDVRPLQEQLALFGLSSLGRSEAHVLATVDAVLSVLCRLAGEEQRLPRI